MKNYLSIWSNLNSIILVCIIENKIQDIVAKVHKS